MIIEHSWCAATIVNFIQSWTKTCTSRPKHRLPVTTDGSDPSMAALRASALTQEGKKRCYIRGFS
jgi:hypothetical protein